ncbi:PAS domain-containing hybrid sensor histidine kinase/response regulator [Leifsonia sp. L25]|uniref:PAS domain-containing hybrid sensor histidine kinase/response regulator n=1 Tax=Leifsonia sp. L25 TaxID=3423957 RepID=UPI003D6829DC
MSATARSSAPWPELLRSSLDQVHDAIGFVDREWRFTFANSWALQLAGIDEGRLRDHTLWEMFPTTMGGPFERIYREAMDRGLAGTARAFVPDWGCWFEVDAHPTEEGIAIIVRDVTEDQRSREKLEEYTRRVEAQAALLDAARDAIIVRDLRGTVRYWNGGAETIYGIPAAQAVGRSIRDLLYEDPVEFDAADANLLRDGYWVGELRQRRADGSPIVADCRWQLSRGEDGQVTVFAVNSDITEYRREQEQRIRTQRMESLGTLAGGIAHDLNNVLTPILMSVQLLRQDEQDPRRRDMLDALDAAAQRGAAMIRQVLSFARGSEGRRAPVDVVALLWELGRFCRETLPKSIEVRVESPDRLPAISGDETELFQVLVNLVTNARDAMPDGGVLTIRASESDHGVRLEVRDSGCGMDARTASRILEPFFTTKATGTGLGLPTSAAIVKAHGGELEVDSAPGAGTAIGFELPGLAVAPPWPRAADVPVAGPGRGRRVLVVDDEEAICELVRQTLDQRGFVTEVAQGVEALELLMQGRRFDAVLTDVMMPGVQGDAIARRLAAEQPHTAVVLDERDAARSGHEARRGTRRRAVPGETVHPGGAAGGAGRGARRPGARRSGGADVTDADAVLRSALVPVLRDAVAVLSGAPSPEERADLATRLAAAAEESQRALGEDAREPRIHHIVGAAASASMALSLGDGVVPTADIVERLREGLRLGAAGSRPPEDQDPAD